MTAGESDIYGNMTWILQKNSGYDGQFSLIDRVFSLHEAGPAAELRRRHGDLEKALGSAGDPSIVSPHMCRLVGDADMKGNVCATCERLASVPGGRLDNSRPVAFAGLDDGIRISGDTDPQGMNAQDRC